MTLSRLIAHTLILLAIAAAPHDDADLAFQTWANSDATQAVRWCESKNNDQAEHWVYVRGYAYRVVGAMQLLLDRPMRNLAADLGYTPDDLLDYDANMRVAFHWAMRTDNGIPYRLWSCGYAGRQ